MPHLDRDGVKLYYDDAGRGEPSMVFVHGWCCDRSHFSEQVAHFSPAHRCVSLDLRGHGESDAPNDACTIPALADDVAFVCDELGLRKPVIVGHSMGGAIALSLAARYPDLPSAIVMLDGAILQPDALIALVEELNPVLHSDGYLEPLTQIFHGMFIATDDAARHERIVAAAIATPRHVVVAEWDALWSYDSAADAALCKVPALYVGAHAPAGDMARIREAMPHALVAQTAGAGHFHQLEVPEQVNAMIERFLAISGLGAGG